MGRVYAVTVVARDAAVAREAVDRFALARMALLAGAQPDLSGMVSGGRGHATLSLSSMGGMVDVATPAGRTVWARLAGRWSGLDGADGGYVLGVVGLQAMAGDGLALGVMAQVDRMRSVEGAVVTEGTGWLVGPYVVARLPETALTVQGRVLFGGTSNGHGLSGAVTERFDGTRMLAQLGLSGEVMRGDVMWRPNLQASYAREVLEAHVDASDTPVPSRRMALAEVKAGVEVVVPVRVDSGQMEARLALSGVWAEAAGQAAEGLEGFRGAVSVGLQRSFASGAELSVSGSHDGIGSGGWRGFGLDLRLEQRF